MEKDYILIAVDPNSKFAIRFMSLEHNLKQSLKLHDLPENFQKTYAEFLMASVMLGSRADEQESTLYKLKFENCPLSINCEVSPIGYFRSAIFPTKNKDKFQADPTGQMKVVRLKKENEFYQSVVAIKDHSILKTFQNYLYKSAQRKSVFYLNTDTKNFKNNYGLWVEKLPDTKLADWNKFIQRFKKKNFFENSFKDSSDPDKIIQHLFPETISILAVTKPKLKCSCNKERIIDALNILPNEELVDMFMEGQGIETKCDYCHKIWKISDKEVTGLIKASGSVH